MNECYGIAAITALECDEFSVLPVTGKGANAFKKWRQDLNVTFSGLRVSQNFLPLFNIQITFATLEYCKTTCLGKSLTFLWVCLSESISVAMLE